MLGPVSASWKDLNSLSLLQSYYSELLNLFLLYYQWAICIHRTLTKISTSIFMAVIIDFLPKIERFLFKKNQTVHKKFHGF